MQKEAAGGAERALIHPIMRDLPIKVTAKLLNEPKNNVKCSLASLGAHAFLLITHFCHFVVTVLCIAVLHISIFVCV